MPSLGWLQLSREIPEYHHKNISYLQESKEKKMSAQKSLVSTAFQTFMSEAPKHAQAWSALVQELANASALDKKTSALAYLAVLAALRMESGIPFHVQTAKLSGASREEVISAILVGLPAAGHIVTQVLPTAIAAFDAI
jgi:alkylhydroperoxidase/carboxymuconolactone decarboxylase family protein YurZ